MHQVKSANRSKAELGLMALIGAAFLIGPMYYTTFVLAPHTTGSTENTVQIQEEDRLFCEGFGFQSGTPLRARCESELELIRARQSVRAYNVE